MSRVIARYKSDIQTLLDSIGEVITGQSRKNYQATRKRFVKYKLPAALAQELNDKTTLASAFDIIEIKTRLGGDTESVAKLFYALSDRLQLPWIRDAISKTIVRTHWNHLAILNLRNDLHANQHNLTELVMQCVDNRRHTNKAMSIWEDQHVTDLRRYDSILREFRSMRTCDFPTISVAVSEVRRLVQLAKRQQELSAAE